MARRTSVIFAAAILSGAACAGGAAAQTGAVYPADVVPTLQADDGDTPARAFGDATALARALGPAAYILTAISPKEDFRSAIRRAIGRHPAFHAQVSALDETRAGRRRAASALYPQLSTQFRGDYVIQRDFDPDTDNIVESLRPREQFTVGVSASQLVFDGGAAIQRIRSARARHREFENAISTRINDLAISALTAYHDLATHQALVQLADAVVARHREILGDVIERERLGAGSRADITRAEARLAAARARRAEIAESARLAEIRYEEFFGEPAGALIRPSLADLVVDSRSEAIDAALRLNPELAVAEARADASRAEFRAAQGARFPEVRVSVDAVKFDVFEGGDDFDVRAGLNVDYDIFGGGARAATIKEASSRARQARFVEDETRQDITREAAMAYERVEGSGDRLSALEAAVIAHDKTRDLVLERYRVARGDLIDVLQAENDYFEAAVGYLTGLATRDLSAYALMEHTGDLIKQFSPQEEYADLVGLSDDG